METTSWVVRWGLAGFAGAVVGYCVLVLVVVATAPDLRMRFLLVGPTESPAGIVIEKTIDLVVAEGKPVPQAKDVLLELDGVPITTCLDFMREQFGIRNHELDRLRPGYRFGDKDAPDLAADKLLPQTEDLVVDREAKDFVVRNHDRDRVRQGSRLGDKRTQDFADVKFRRHADGAVVDTEVRVQAVPLSEVSLTLIWFLLEPIIFSVGAVAFWSRPFDDAARLFFAM